MLEINKNDKKINFNKNKPSKKIAALAVGAVLALYSGASIFSDASIEESYAIDEIEYNYDLVPESCYEDVMGFCGCDYVTKKDLEKLESLNMCVNSTDSLEFLKYCKNLKDLDIFFNRPNPKNLNTFPHLNSLESLRIVSTEDTGVITEDSHNFFKNCKGLKSLQINNFSVLKNTLEQLDHVNSIGYAGRNFYVDLNKVDCNTFNLEECGVYDLPLFFDKEDYNILNNRKIKVEFGSKEKENKFFEIDSLLQKKVDSMNLNSKTTEKEKLNKVLYEVLESLDYSQDINNEDPSKDTPGYDDFYHDGALYAVIEEKYQICGNYAGYFQALAHKAKLDSYYAASEDHAWNLVKIDGEIYLLDPTWLDNLNATIEVPTMNKHGNDTATTYETKKVSELIKENNADQVEWYLEDPTQEHINEIDGTGSHKYKNYTKEFGKESIPEMGNKQVNVSLNGKKVITAMGSVVGLGIPLGFAFHIPTSRRKNENVIESKNRHV